MRFRRMGVPSVETAMAFDYKPAELEYIVYSRERAAIGDPATVKARLEELATELDVDELVLLTITYDFADRVRSYQLVADAFGLSAATLTVAVLTFASGAVVAARMCETLGRDAATASPVSGEPDPGSVMLSTRRSGT